MHRSDELFLREQVGSEKFEYFATGISGALCAYVSQTLEPEKLSFSPNTLEVFALLVLCFSVYCGFKRIEFLLAHIQCNRKLLLLEEEKERLVTANPEKILMHSQSLRIYSPDEVVTKITELSAQIKVSAQDMDKVANISGAWYRRRNLSLGTGFLFLVFARIISAYF